MLTGGTGFIGGHSVTALLAEGHEPHLLVRDPEKLERLCELHGLDPAAVSFTVGDMTDERSVLLALKGCDACLHAAAVTSIDPADGPEIVRVNSAGSRTILDAAVAAGCDPVIHVSSMSAIFPPTGERMSGDDPVEEGGAPYPASKAESELHARGLQASGHPVVIVYPGGVVGPKDVGVNGGESTIAGLLKSPVVVRPPTGGILLVDVRDLAAAVARLVVAGGPRRYVAGGNFVTWDQLATDLESVTGVSRPPNDVTEQDMMAIFGRSAARYLLGLKPGDDEPLQRDTGVTWRPFNETLADLLAWMESRSTLPTPPVEDGHT
jgi:nucleoside-diphosphate-sugar epimerase